MRKLFVTIFDCECPVDIVNIDNNIDEKTHIFLELNPNNHHDIELNELEVITNNSLDIVYHDNDDLNILSSVDVKSIKLLIK